MPQYPLLKQEQYQNVGGINQKSSEYITQDTQVLNLRNFMFERPGAWISRPGYTGFATLTAGQSFPPISLYDFVLTTGASYILYNSGNTLYSMQGNSALINVQGQSAVLDFETYNNNAYFANGKAFASYSGTLAVNLNQPYVVFGESFAGKGVSIKAGWLPTNMAGGVSAGFYQFVLAYVNQQGTVGPALVDLETPFLPPLPGNEEDYKATFNPTNLAAGTYYFELHGITVPPGFYGPTVYVQPYYKYSATLPINQTTDFLSVPLYQGLGFPLYLQVVDGVTTYSVNFPISAGITTVTDNILFSLAPRYLELYNNMMFYSGQSYYTEPFNTYENSFSTLSAVSRIYVSNIDDPEYVAPESFFDIVTNNGDYVVGMVPFQQSLIVFKRSSIHEVTGFSPDTLNLETPNYDFGCVSNEAFVTFENKLWFMDFEGIAEYAGANTTIVSYRVEGYLNECDKESCKAFHLKKYHQVWFACKINGSTNYRIFIYDYASDQWGIYDTFYDVSVMALKEVDLRSELMFYGKNQSLIPKFFSFGQSMTSDDSFGITHIIQTKFHKRLGDSTQELWRRLFVNNDIRGSTLTATLNFYPDYGSSIYSSRTMGFTLFQTRIDFGISAKSMSVEMIVKSNSTVKINGYTIVARYLRSV